MSFKEFLFPLSQNIFGSQANLNKNNKIVFFDWELKDIDILLSGRIKNHVYIPVAKDDSFGDLLIEKLNVIDEVVSISIVSHGSSRGLNIGKDGFNESQLNYIKNRLEKCINIKEIY